MRNEGSRGKARVGGKRIKMRWVAVRGKVFGEEVGFESCTSRGAA